MQTTAILRTIQASEFFLIDYSCPLFFIFVFSGLQLTDKFEDFLLMSRFEPQISGFGSDRSANCATTTALPSILNWMLDFGLSRGANCQLDFCVFAALEVDRWPGCFIWMHCLGAPSLSRFYINPNGIWLSWGFDDNGYEAAITYLLTWRSCGVINSTNRLMAYSGTPLFPANYWSPKP